jgi:ATP adenylyltransferase
MVRDHLWAPWRGEYVERGACEADGTCFLCEAWMSKDDRHSRVVCRSASSFVILNIYPYNAGHIMVAPSAHTGNIEDLHGDALRDLMELVQQSVRALKRAYSPQGINIGMNLGRSAGAGLEDHIHFHLVPRWNGDTNFMPVLAETKVISEHLEKTYERLRKAFEEIGRESR